MDYETKRLRIVMWTVVALLILNIGWLTHYVLTRKQPNNETKKEHRLFLFFKLNKAMFSFGERHLSLVPNQQVVCSVWFNEIFVEKIFRTLAL